MNASNRLLRRRAQQVRAHGKAVIATDVGGLVVFWNRKAEELYGWRSSEALGHNIVDLTPALQSRAEAAQIMKLLRSGEAWSGRFPVRDRNGRTFVIDVTDTPVFTRYGKLIGIIGVSSAVRKDNATGG